MANLNKVFLIGNLTRDPELRYTPNGTAVTEFGMAMNRNWTSQSGEKKEDTCFVDLQAWGRGAEVISEYCRKGRALFVEGRLSYDSWEGRDGQRRSRLRVTVENFQFLGGRRDGDGGGGGGGERRGPRRQQSQPPRGEQGDGPPDDAGNQTDQGDQPEYQIDDDIPF